jgi:RNA polymerase sigma-70 factor (ECF subfamily)
MADEDLDAWMQAAQAGDAGAYARVVEGTQYAVRAVLLRDTADHELAEELAQEAYATAWAKREQYRPGTSPRAWLLAIARSRLIDRQRRQDRERRNLPDLLRQELLRHRPADQPREAMLEALRACLSGLGEEHRRLIDMVHFQGLTCEAAAGELGIQPDACRQRMSRLQRKLRECAEGRLETER